MNIWHMNEGTTSEPNYFWVNQGDRYKDELVFNCIAAPIDNVHHHKRLRNLKLGDVIIHYANSEISFTGKCFLGQNFQNIFSRNIYFKS